MSIKEYNQAVTAATQAQVRQAIAVRNNAMSMRSFRQELVQATAAYTAFSAGANIFNTVKEFDSLGASMRLFAKDDAGVADTMAYLNSESERLGINFAQAAEGFTKFSIVSRNKMTESQRKEFFSGFSEYATVMQIDQYRFQRSLMAVQQMMSKGKISSEELRLQ
jgi:phage tail tape-measure protein